MLNAYFLRHKPQQQVDIIALAQQQRQLGLLKRVQKPFSEFFSLDRDNADGGVFGDAPPNIGISTAPASPPAAGVAPALKRKSKVAATLDTPVKCIGW